MKLIPGTRRAHLLIFFFLRRCFHSSITLPVASTRVHPCFFCGGPCCTCFRFFFVFSYYLSLRF